MKTQLEAIRAIDPAAADYIEKEVIPKYPKDKLDEYLKSRRQKLFWKKRLPKYDLLDLFIWELTPVGRHYWLKIWRELNGTSTD